MKKLRELSEHNADFMPPEAFRRAQWRRGFPLSFIGLFVYAALRITRHKPLSYHGICPYFRLGKGWGGFEMGWFFVVSCDAGEKTCAHELGHGLANANIGGVRMLFCSTLSTLRYWKIRLFGSKKEYDSWWFESQATRLGQAYLERLFSANNENDEIDGNKNKK